MSWEMLNEINRVHKWDAYYNNEFVSLAWIQFVFLNCLLFVACNFSVYESSWQSIQLNKSSDLYILVQVLNI